MKLLIGIVTYNSRGTIERCLQSAIEASKNFQSEIVVFDNASSDETVDFIQKQFPDVSLIISEENRGYAFGVNRIAESTQWDYLIILNPDLFVYENAIQIGIEYAQTNPDVGLIGARLVDSDGNSVHSHGDIPTPDSFLMDFSGVRRLFSTGSNSYKSVDEEIEPFEAGFITGAFMLIPHESWQLIDSLDECFFLYFEDVDLAYRIREEGKSICVNPKILAEHESGSSFIEDDEGTTFKLRCWFESAYKFFKKHHGKDEQHRIINTMIKMAKSKSLLLKLVLKGKGETAVRQKIILDIHEEILRNYSGEV